MERVVDELWEKARERFPTSMMSLLESFDGDLDGAKNVIKDAVAGKDSSSKSSVYHHLFSTDNVSISSRKNRVEGNIALLRTMVYQSELARLIPSLLQVVPTTEGINEGRENSLLHLAAKNGFCFEFESSFSGKEADVVNGDGETPLHLAAEFGHTGDVEMLLRVGASLKADDRGYTALHSAAMSSCCNPNIVSILLSAAGERGEKFRFLNQQSNVDSGRNTALHVAAGNPNVTSEFILEFWEADPRIQNAEMETPFHVAASSSNPDAIVYMLTTFKSSNAGWDIQSMDANRGDEATTLVNTCAGNGNAQAVALLMQQGADISQGTLGQIVIESVKKPEMIDNFLAVYQTIVDNAVAWMCLKKNKKSLTRGSPEYNTALRETMIYLTTKPTDGKNMIQRCIEFGAADLLAAILNTDNVYRFDEFGVQKNDLSETRCSYSRYDVTDFARLIAEPDTRPGGPESRALRSPGLDFTTKFHPKTTYLDELLMHFDEWKNTDLFTSQPLRKLTQPYFGFVQRYYFVIGLIQMLFMICFAVNFTPDACSLATMFGPGVNSRCNHSLDAITVDDVNVTRTNWTRSAPTRHRQAPLFLWLIWPTILFAGSIIDCLILSLWYTGINLFHSEHTPKKNNLSQLARKRTDSWLMQMLLASFHIFPLLAFCISFLTWYDRHSSTRNKQSYLEATAMVFLFGWMTNFVLFSGISKELHVFLMVLKEIIIKDMILNFSLVFIFTVIAFSCTLHTLRMLIESHETVFTRTTIYEIFMSALGVGDFIERVTEDSEEIEPSMGLFFAVYAMYVCFTLIILMNILIAMLSNRYEDARQRAENVWRFETVKTAQIIEDFNVFRKFIHIDDMTFGYLGCFFRCRRQVYQDPDFPGREFVDVQTKLENSESN